MRYVKQSQWDINTVAKKLHSKMEATKRVSKSQIKVTDIEKVLNTIAIVNSMDEFETVLEGRLLSDYEVPACFRAFIAPKKVTIGNSSRYPDLREVRDTSGLEPCTVEELTDFIDKLGATYKVSNIGTVKLSERDAKTLNDCKEAMILVEGCAYVVSDDDAWFVPVGLKKCVNDCVGTKVFNEDADYVLENFLNHFTFVSQ